MENLYTYFIAIVHSRYGTLRALRHCSNSESYLVVQRTRK